MEEPDLKVRRGPEGPPHNRSKRRRGGGWPSAFCLLLSAFCLLPLGAAQDLPAFRGALISSAQTTSKRLVQLRAQGVNAVSLDVQTAFRDRAAANRIRAAGLALYYWIEIGRNPELAAAHPAWMASLQGHLEWRRHFPNAPVPKEGEVVKNYPWVPIVYKESFEAHLRRVAGLLQSMPPPDGIFLNDLQAAPSACGCGNVLCRWTPDYGPIQTATRLPAGAAARFIGEVAKLAPKARIIPVWTTECEEHDKNAECAGVGCYAGLCWKEYTAQLMPVAKQSETLAVLALYRALGRDLPRYGSTAGWVGHALRSFAEMPPKNSGRAIPAGRVIAVLQGWEVTKAEIEAQLRQSRLARAAGYLVSYVRIDQSWEPKVLKTTRKSATALAPIAFSRIRP